MHASPRATRVLIAGPLALLLGATLAAPAFAQDAEAALDGTWAVDPGIGSFDYDAGDFSGSWVGYRVPEELVSIGGVTAVGRTPDIGGTITVEGTSLASADLTADLTTLRSDSSFRDRALSGQGIVTNEFPTATFVLTEPIELGELPAEGESFAVEATGDLTLHGVTQNVTIPLNAVWQGDIIGVSGSLTFPWELFEMERPTAMSVVSLADEVTMELQVFFRQDDAA
jgi:polyisoprenoid-binding protein YceI